MSRWQPIESWEGAVHFAALTGRQFIATPRGLIPHYPYLMDSLRPPRPKEEEAIDGEIRLVLDVSEVLNVEQAIERRWLYCAPWNTYTVVRHREGAISIAYLVRTGLRHLKLTDAVTVALAAGYDVAGWPAGVQRGQWIDRWNFDRPDSEAHDFGESPASFLYLVAHGSA